MVSGEHDSLPHAEIRAILESEGFEYGVSEVLPQVLCLEAEKGCIMSVSSRSGFARVAGVELFRCRADLDEIYKLVREVSYGEYLDEGQSFSVRIKRVRGSSPDLDVEGLEAKVGASIMSIGEGLKVRLENPDRAFFGVLTGGNFVFGLKEAALSPKPMLERRPRRRPFFHPSSLMPKLARCMVNLARPRRGDTVLDPFCGTGSILIEAGLMGMKALGSDIKRHMALGSLRNLHHFGIRERGILVADARRMPYAYANCMVTDPPYGRSATTLGSTTKAIVSNFLSSAIDILPRHGHLCIASPMTVGVSEMGRNAGFRVVEAHFFRVHRSLTREITVLEKP